MSLPAPPSPFVALPAAQPLENWRNLRMRLLWAYDGAVKPENLSHLYDGNAVSGWLLRRGSVRLVFDDREERFGEGQWVFPRGKAGWQEFTGGAEILSLHFYANWPTGQPLFERSQSVALPAGSAPGLTRAGERLARFVGRHFPEAGLLLEKSPGSATVFFGMERALFHWLGAWAAAMRREGVPEQRIGGLDERVRRVLRHLEGLPMGAAPQMRELEEVAGLSRSQLHRLFVGSLGMPPADYWQRRRVELAGLAILEGSRPFKVIAGELGFGSLAHFSHWVRQRLGCSPRYLRAHGGQKGKRR